MQFSKEEYIQFLINNGVVGFFPEGRTLKSGRISHWYANCRSVCDTVGNLEYTGWFILGFAENLGLTCDYFYGVPEGCTKTGLICNYLKSKTDGNPDQRIIMGRGKHKEHGAPEDKFFIGPVNKGDRVIVLEDVTTTGSSMLNAVEGLREAGVEPFAVIAMVNRLEKRDDGKSVEEKVRELGMDYYAMADAEDLLKEYISREQPGAELVKQIEEDFRNGGIREISL